MTSLKFGNPVSPARPYVISHSPTHALSPRALQMGAEMPILFNESPIFLRPEFWKGGMAAFHRFWEREGSLFMKDFVPYELRPEGVVFVLSALSKLCLAHKTEMTLVLPDISSWHITANGQYREVKAKEVGGV